MIHCHMWKPILCQMLRRASSSMNECEMAVGQREKASAVVHGIERSKQRDGMAVCLCVLFSVLPNTMCVCISYMNETQMNSLRLFSAKKIANPKQKCACVSACKANTHTCAYAYIWTFLSSCSCSLALYLCSLVHPSVYPWCIHEIPTIRIYYMHCMYILFCFACFSLSLSVGLVGWNLFLISFDFMNTTHWQFALINCESCV